MLTSAKRISKSQGTRFAIKTSKGWQERAKKVPEILPTSSKNNQQKIINNNMYSNIEKSDWKESKNHSEKCRCKQKGKDKMNKVFKYLSKKHMKCHWKGEKKNLEKLMTQAKNEKNYVNKAQEHRMQGKQTICQKFDTLYTVEIQKVFHTLYSIVDSR